MARLASVTALVEPRGTGSNTCRGDYLVPRVLAGPAALDLVGLDRFAGEQLVHAVQNLVGPERVPGDL